MEFLQKTQLNTCALSSKVRLSSLASSSKQIFSEIFHLVKVEHVRAFIIVQSWENEQILDKVHG